MRTLLALSLALSILGCREPEEIDPSKLDQDGDGFVAADDCDDFDDSIHPDADEVCDGVDNDCSGLADDGAVDALTWYADVDGDGYGDAEDVLTDCEQPMGYISRADDCDDDSARFHPGAPEEDCTDPNDYNCDGSVGYADADADGWAACEECDDSDAAVNPEADEVCNDTDDDCNGLVDEDAIDAPSWYLDADQDGFGNATISQEDCDQPAGYVSNADDCDDLHGASYPGGTEVCDEHDNDCDGTVDESDAADAPTWYEDADGDLWGDSTTATTQCDAPDSSWVTRSGDCDDDHAAASPVGTEVCDELDNDCDGTTDEPEAVDASTWYADDDGDSYGDADDTTPACDQPSGYVSDDSDCDDTDADVNPAATELCNEVDDDCDGTVDEDDADDASTWYADLDGDGYGGSRLSTVACEAPSGWVDSADDCNDFADVAYPGGTEVCDSYDNDCDGTADEDDATDASTWYADADGDGYGDASDTDIACDEPSGYVDNDDDCDDTAATSNPSAWEVCDGADNDCDGSTDGTSAIDADTWYLDADGDSYGDPLYDTESCDEPSGYADNDDDCDDSDADISPADTESCDGIDNDCDGDTDEGDAVDADTWYADDDSDGYGDPDDSTTACDQPTGYVSDDSDCHDTDATAYPGSHATETPGDGIDQDCDGEDACGDLTCDGYRDIFQAAHYYTSGGYTQNGYVFEGSSTGLSSTASYFLPTYGHYDSEIADLDGDGYLDIVVANAYSGSSYSTNSYVYWGSAAGYSSSDRTDLPTLGVLAVELADLDEDGYLEIIFGNHYNGSSHNVNSYIYWGASSGYSTADRTDLPSYSNRAVVAEDLDLDGYIDLAFCNYRSSSGYSTNSYVYWGSSSGFSTSDSTALPMYGCHGMAVEDIDLDGYPDLLTASHYDGDYDSTSYIWWGSSGGYSTSDRTSFSTHGALGVIAEDIDLDGYIDVGFAQYRNASGSYTVGSDIYWGDSTYAYTTYTTLPSAGAHDFSSGDFNGDSYTDIAVCNYYSGSSHYTDSYVYWGSSTGSYSSSSRSSIATVGCVHSLAADMDEDGYDDLFFASYHDGYWTHSWTSSVYWGSTSGLTTYTALGAGGWSFAVEPGVDTDY